MSVRSTAQLKAWFRRGMFPTEEQFADWMDSYVHKNESRLSLSQIEGLIDLLNGKYEASLGADLEQRQSKLESLLTDHIRQADAMFDDISDDIGQLETDVETVVAKNEEQDAAIAALQSATDADAQVFIDAFNIGYTDETAAQATT